MKSRILIFFINLFLICTSNILSQYYKGTFCDWTIEEILELPNTKILEASGYKGVMIVLPGNYIRDGEIDHKKAERILNELNNRFMEMVKAYKNYQNNPEGYKGSDIRDSWEKNLLPSCTTEAIDRLLADLQNKRKYFYILWTIEGQKWDDDGIEYDGRGEGSGHCDYCLEKYGEGRIEIFDAYAYRSFSDSILASSLLFHEFVHLIKVFYPDCFQVKPVCLVKKLPSKERIDYEKKRQQEESSTEDSTSKIFGGKIQVIFMK